MRAERRVRYATLEQTRPAIAPRSTLYTLAPAAVGTPAVEALSSYVARLAEAHSVSCGALIRHLIGPRLGRRLSRPSSAPLGINGDGRKAVAWAAAVGELVGLAGLDRLTLAGAGEVRRLGRALSACRRWCPACLSDFRETGSCVYEPLVWSVARVDLCGRHAFRLEHRCPGCGDSAAWLLPRSRAGFCPHCGCWLGADGRRA